MIKKYQKFIETFIPDKNDTPDIVSVMNNNNIDEKNIKEYNNKKSIISNLYQKYKSEDELINTLFANKFISSKTDIKSMKFNNPLLEWWSRICKKNREISNIEMDIKKYQDQITQQKENIMDNPSAKQSIESNIKLIQNQLSQKNKEVSQKKTEIQKMDNDLKNEINMLSTKINKSKNDLNNYNNSKSKIEKI